MLGRICLPATQTPDCIPPIHIPIDVADMDIPVLICFDVLYGICLIAGNIYNRRWHLIVQANDPLEIVDKWLIPLIRDPYQLYVNLHELMSPLHTIK